MLTSLIVRLVDFSRRFSFAILFIALVLSVAMGAFVAQTIKINTDIDQLMSAELGWRKREKELDAAFPQKTDRLVIVVDGSSPDAAEYGAALLFDALKSKPELFKTVVRPEKVETFRKNGLLFLSEDELSSMLDVVIKAQPMLGSLSNDPSLRGLFNTMGLAVEGIQRGETDYKNLEPSFNVIAQTLESVLNGQDQLLPWQSMMSDHAPTIRDLRKYILTQPVLDFGDLSPGAKAGNVVRQLAEELKLTPEHGIQVRLTGSVALNDEEFASVAEGTGFATILSGVLVIVILFLALRSYRLILPILLTLIVGLIATTAFAMYAVGSLNLISVAFAVMFMGIAVDFGIQFGVRYRDEHHREPDSNKAMLATAKIIAAPLTLAAGSTALGFLAFIPTDYRGVSELGIIAGAGMIIAFVLNVTVLPALLALFRPPAEPEAIGFPWAAPVDRFLMKYRSILLGLIAVIALGALAVASQVRFDFDPLNLKNPQTESVSTLFDIMKDPDATPYTVQILAPNLDEAKALASKIDALPEVDHTITLASFVPKNQDKKLALIEDARFLLDPTLNPASLMAPPTGEEVLETLTKTAAKLRSLGEERTAAQRLAKSLDTVVAQDNMQLLDRMHRMMINGMTVHLAQLRDLLATTGITQDGIDPALRADWITADGRAKIEVYPKGNARDHKVLTAFTESVLRVAPEASGSPISIQESGKTVVNAFIKAGIFGILAICAMTLVILRRPLDVVRLIAPLILAGILTLATMVILPLPLNFANIIALPLLLSLGVSYAIYFVSYWRAGEASPLSSSMARAVLFSACTTLVAFGSLSLSSHPGTQGMGELLTIALLYSLASTFIVLPVLLGPPPLRKIN